VREPTSSIGIVLWNNLPLWEHFGVDVGCSPGVIPRVYAWKLKMDIEYKGRKLGDALVNWTTPFLSVGHAPRSHVSSGVVRGNGGRRAFPTAF